MLPKSSANRKRPSGYYFLTPVWGEPYTRLYLDVCIPSQLSPGNLPAFHDIKESRYVIITTPDDEQIIRQHPIFPRLQEVMDVTFEYLPEDTVTNHDLMSLCHKRGIEMADEADCAALFLNPDLVFADGSFATVRRRCEEGYDTIIAPGIRTLKQGVLHALGPQLTSGEPFVVVPRELMRVALDNLHPLANSSWWEEELDADLIPATLYWRAGDEGIVSRNFHLHPLMVYPQRKGSTFFGTIDDDYMVTACPDGRYEYIVEDSDELLAIELSDPGHLFLTGFSKGSIDDCATWAEQFTHARHRMYFDAVVKMHVGMEDQDAWAQAEKKAQAVASEIKAELKRSSWELFKHDSARLKRRLIRWSLDHEIERANYLKKRSATATKYTLFSWLDEYRQRMNASQHMQTLSVDRHSLWSSFVGQVVDCSRVIFWVGLTYLKVIPARIILFYYKFIWKFAVLFGALKRKVYGPLWYPYPWTWRYRYFTRMRQDAQDILDECNGPTLIITHDKELSLATECSKDDKTVRYGYLHQQQGRVTLLDQDAAEPYIDAQFGTIIVERALSPIRQINEVITEIARLMRPGGKLVLLVNRMAAPGDRLEYEICLTTTAVKKLVSPEFSVVSQKKQGAFALGLVHYLLHWVKVRSGRVRIPFLFIAMLSTIFAPINIAMAVIGNIITYLLDRLDNTDKYYISSMTVATKADAP